MNELHTYMQECAAEAARIARGVKADQLGDVTPCAEYDVRALVNHWVLYTSHGLERRAQRRPIPEELTERDFAGEEGWAEAYAAQLDRAVAAWSDPAAWEGEIDLGFATSPASEVAQLIIKETAVHGWDVARATGQEFHVSDAVGEMLLKVVDEHAELYRQYDGFADPVPLGSGTAFERALALSGRDPRWTP
ncbi:TIGR03086 family metal-binding protein [Actinomadura rudentiformis]|uniref:TIGR03086 family protein n=1 Tax=Actinomadura rudentiformis TaxID=359158 RepID=A0A6H9YW10_9ACTN|nr:TIGR03086 family metal-binding protein [Actinomadura rudentiformis]KAB2351457.1 TIGR03086 family protein [Actinomadura rudentiformis]